MMAGQCSLRPLVIASFVVSFGLLGASLGTSMLWASSHEKPMKPEMMQKKPQMMPGKPAAQAAPQLMMTQPPTTLDAYLSYVQDKIQLEAMKVQQAGVVDVKLTIAKDGTIQRIEVVRVDGPAALRDQITSMLNQMGKLPPLPAGANADVLVMDTTVAFNYPSTELFDHLGPRRMGR